MAKDITIGFKYRDKEERLWQGNKLSAFVPSSKIGKTYMVQFYIIQAFIHFAESNDGRTKFISFNLNIKI